MASHFRAELSPYHVSTHSPLSVSQWLAPRPRTGPMSPSYLSSRAIGRPRRPRPGRRKASCARGPSDPKRTAPERFKPHPRQVKGETAWPLAARQACRGPSAARRARERPHVPAPVASRPSVTDRTVPGRTRGWRVGPLWRRGSADRPDERGRDGVRRRGNGRRRGRGYIMRGTWGLPFLSSRYIIIIRSTQKEGAQAREGLGHEN
jgi:hypothetical protein